MTKKSTTRKTKTDIHTNDLITWHDETPAFDHELWLKLQMVDSISPSKKRRPREFK